MVLSRPSVARLLLLVIAQFALLVTPAWAAAADPDTSGGTAPPPAKSRGAAPVPAAGAITFSEYSRYTSITTQYLSSGVRFTSEVYIENDRAQPTSPVLSGEPQFQGDVDGVFTVPGTDTPTTVDGFSMDVGYINNRDSVVVDYFDASGRKLGSRSAQSYGINHIAIYVRGIASFSIHRVSYELAGFSVDNLSIQRGAIGARPTRMAAFGDSYSAGEGLIPDGTGIRYDCGTDMAEGPYHRDTTLPYGFFYWDAGIDCDTRTLTNARPADLFSRGSATHANKCHRHQRAYPNAIRTALGISGANSIFVACSGAVTKNIGLTVEKGVQHPKSPVNVAGGELQIKNVDDWTTAGGAPNVVTVGIGGNDAGFTGIIKHCAKKDCANDWDWRDGIINGINGFVYARLQETFERLRDRFKAATIYAFGYPSVTKEELACPGVSLWKLGIQADERGWVAEELLPTLNAAIADAAAGAGITYVDITAATAGHEICTEQAYINGLRLGTDNLIPVANESFHPNQLGHDAIGRFFLEHYTDGAGQLIGGNPEPVGNIRPEGGREIKVGTVEATSVKVCGDVCLQPSACVQACSLRIQGGGFTPGVQLQGTLLPDTQPQPQPAAAAKTAQARAQEVVQGTPVGTFTADANGDLVATVQLPAGLAEGEHGIEFTGEDADGVGQSAMALFYVFMTEPAPSRVDPAPPPPVVVPKPAAPIATLKVLGWKGRKVYLRVGCPRVVTGTCKVRVALQAPGKKIKAKKGQKPKVGKPRTLRTVSLTLKSGKSRVIGISRGKTSVARKKLTLSVRTTTTAGVATSLKTLKSARTLRKVPKR